MPSSIIVSAKAKDNADLVSDHYVLLQRGSRRNSLPRHPGREGNNTTSQAPWETRSEQLSEAKPHLWPSVDAEAINTFSEIDSVLLSNISSGALEMPSTRLSEFPGFSRDLLNSWRRNPFRREDDATPSSKLDNYQFLFQKALLRDALKLLEALAPSEKSDLEELLGLPLNWDLEGGRSATEDAVTKTAELIVEMYEIGQKKPEVTSITAARDGGVEVTFDGTNGRELFVVVPPHGSDVRYVFSLPTRTGEYVDSPGFLGRDTSLRTLIADLVATG